MQSYLFVTPHDLAGAIFAAAFLIILVLVSVSTSMKQKR